MTTASEHKGKSSPARAAAGISVFTATAIAVADMIGIGVFTSLGFQIKDIDSAFSLILLWVIGGVIALCGALCYGELSAALPRSGGEYNFLSRIYHPSVGFMAGWLSATFGFSAPIALACMAFAAYFNGVVPWGLSPVLLALGIAWAVALIHITGLRLGSAFHNISTIFKMALITAFIVAGFVYGEAQPISFAPSMADFKHVFSAPFAISLVFVMYSYSGWNASTYIINEIDEPQKNVPRSLFMATSIVLVFYVLLNTVFVYTTPLAKMSGELEVALIVGKHIFGEVGGNIVGGLICIGLISAISAMTWIGPRVTETMGADMPMLDFFSRRNKNGAPTAAIILQLIIVTCLIATQSFEKLLEFIQFSLTLSSFAAVLGVIVLRHTQPDLPRPYRTWGYPLTPYIFLAFTLFILIYLIIERPFQSLAGIAVLLAGLALYFILLHQKSPTASRRNPSNV